MGSGDACLQIGTIDVSGDNTQASTLLPLLGEGKGNQGSLIPMTEATAHDNTKMESRGLT